jgi:hypothetical protein
MTAKKQKRQSRDAETKKTEKAKCGVLPFDELRSE